MAWALTQGGAHVHQDVAVQEQRCDDPRGAETEYASLPASTLTMGSPTSNFLGISAIACLLRRCVHAEGKPRLPFARSVMCGVVRRGWLLRQVM
jgi:hypothetical protein